MDMMWVKCSRIVLLLGADLIRPQRITRWTQDMADFDKLVAPYVVGPLLVGDYIFRPRL